MPPSVLDFVPPEHPAHFVRDLVVNGLDLSAIHASCGDARGAPAFHPAMMTALLLYGYTQGVYSSRRIARGCVERLDFQAVTACDKPDFRTISEFRRRHLPALAGLFVQVLKLCAKAGLVKLGHVALDGTKVKANASKHKAMSYVRMTKAEAELAAEVAGWLNAAEATDKAEDSVHGPDKSGAETPDWIADKQKRLRKIREARAALEAEAIAAAEQKAQKAEDQNDGGDPPQARRGPKPKHTPGTPRPNAQRNFTDPDSRIMVGKDGFVQAYNAQAAVDATAQIIVAHGLTNMAADAPSLITLTDAITDNMGRKPKELSADAGYCSEANLAALQARKIAAYIATGRAKRPADRTRGGPLTRAMATKLKRGGHRSRYRLRKQLPEPVFGQIKQARGFRQFLLRGLEKVADEWALVCLAHNIAKMARAA